MSAVAVSFTRSFPAISRWVMRISLPHATIDSYEATAMDGVPGCLVCIFVVSATAGSESQSYSEANRRFDFPGTDRGDAPEAGRLWHAIHSVAARRSGAWYRRGQALDPR